MKFALVPIVVWVVSQTIKFLARYIRGERTLRDGFWIYQWASGAPSTHAAIPSAYTYIVGRLENFGPLFSLSFVVTLLLVYDLAAERKKWELFQEYLAGSGDETLRGIISEGRLRDITGHAFFDILVGMVLGIGIAVILSQFLFL